MGIVVVRTTRSGITWPRPARHCGELTAYRTTAKNQRFFRVNSHWTVAYTPLHKDPKGEAGKVQLTIEAVGAVEGDNINGENLQSFSEMTLGWSVAARGRAGH
jgi:hypothetical protein